MMHRAGRDSELVDGQRPRGDVREGMSAWWMPVWGRCLLPIRSARGSPSTTVPSHASLA